MTKSKKQNKKSKSKQYKLKSKKTKSKRKSNEINSGIESTKGVKGSFNWSQYNLWDIMFNPYFIKHDYKDKSYVFARLVIYKEPKNDIRGFINFLADASITLNRLDKTGPNSIQRITVGIDDKIIFRVGSRYATIVDYIPDYQQNITQNDTGLYNPNKKFRVVSDDRIIAVRSIFSWLKYTAKPQYLKDILTKVEITKGAKLTKKETFSLNNHKNNDIKQIKIKI